jgi:hypothetical protein
MVAVVPEDLGLIAAPTEQDGLPIDAGGEVNESQLEAPILVRAADSFEFVHERTQLVLDRFEALAFVTLGASTALVDRSGQGSEPLPGLENVADDLADERQGPVCLSGGEDSSNHGDHSEVLARILP